MGTLTEKKQNFKRSQCHRLQLPQLHHNTGLASGSLTTTLSYAKTKVALICTLTSTPRANWDLAIIINYCPWLHVLSVSSHLVCVLILYHYVSKGENKQRMLFFFILYYFFLLGCWRVRLCTFYPSLGHGVDRKNVQVLAALACW